MTLTSNDTLTDVVLDSDGYAYRKSETPLDRGEVHTGLRFILDSDKSSSGGNSLHPDSFVTLEHAILKAVKEMGSDADAFWKYFSGVGLTGGYHLVLRSKARGTEKTVNSALLGQEWLKGERVLIDYLKAYFKDTL